MRTIFSYLLQMLLPALLGFALWGLSRPLRFLLLSRKEMYPGPYREGALLACFMFLSGLLALTLTPAGFWPALLNGHFPSIPQPFQGGVNFIPLRESWALLQYYLRHDMWSAIWINFPGNILMFLPIGLFFGLLSDKPRWWKSALTTFFVSLFIEVFQLFVSRGTDVDDLILNTIGGLMGHGVFLLINRLAPGFVQRCAKQRKGCA